MTTMDDYEDNDAGIVTPFQLAGPRRRGVPPRPTREPSAAERLLQDAVRRKVLELLEEGISARTLRRVVDLCRSAGALLLPFEGDDALVDAKLAAAGSSFGSIVGSSSFGENYGARVIHELVAGMKTLQQPSSASKEEDSLSELLLAYRMAADAKLPELEESIKARLQARLAPAKSESASEPSLGVSIRRAEGCQETMSNGYLCDRDAGHLGLHAMARKAREVDGAIVIDEAHTKTKKTNGSPHGLRGTPPRASSRKKEKV